MASETVNAIFSAERANAEKVAEAKAKAGGIIADADAEAAAIASKIIDEAKQKARLIEAEAQKKAASIADGSESNSNDDLIADKERYAAAVSAVKAKALE